MIDCIEYESQKYKGHPEGGGFMSPKIGTTIFLTVTTASDPIPVDNTDDFQF